MDFSQHIFRSSGVHHLMTGTIGLSEAQKVELADYEKRLVTPKGLTVNQKEELGDLEKKDRTENQEKRLQYLLNLRDNPVGLTETQDNNRKKLIYQRDNDSLPEGAKNWLKKERKRVKYNRRRQLISKYIRKGNAMEEEAITMVSLLTGELFTNNKERFYNDYITGEYDIYVGEDPNNIEHGLDTKCSWDLDTFPDFEDKLDSNYYWQNQCYMWLSGAKRWTTVYCLTNCPMDELDKMKYREGWEWEHNEVPNWKLIEILNTYIYDRDTFIKMLEYWDCKPVKDDTSPENIKAMEIVADFVDMPLEERIVFKTIERDEERIGHIKQRIGMARNFLVSLEDREIPKLKL